MRDFSAHVITVRDPFHPLRHREVRALDCAGPIAALAPQTDQPFIILRNGEAVLRADSDCVRNMPALMPRNVFP